MPLDKTIIQQIRNNSITILRLNHKQIGDEEAKELAETLKNNKSITTLYLHNNQIGDEEAKELAEALKNNKSITTLYLHNNQIGDAGAKGLAEAVKDNKSITTLNLRNNQIGDAGAKGLAEAVKDNKSITTLNLRNNQIGDAGAKGLAEAVKDNKSITTLNLRNNQIGDAGAKGLAEAVKDNKSITTLNLRNNQIGDVVAKEIAEALKINQGLADKAKQEAEKLKQQQQAEVAEKARQEAEILEQEAKLREQEEAKAIEEAAKLKAIEEAKVKEYVPEIQVVKLFEVTDGDNQFDNDDQATIKQVSNLIRDGNDRLQEHSKKGILLLGDTGAGKSTLAHVFTGRKLQAIKNDVTKEMVIDAMQLLDDIVIGHNMASETKIPNKCLFKDLTIWDCPGFNDTDPIQEIANNFYIKRLFETTDQLKFVLVVDESDLRSKRGSIFLETLYNFIKSFKDIESIEDSISLVVTHVSPNKNIQNIKESINAILRDNQILNGIPGAKEKCKAVINKLKVNCSIHLFYEPSEEGELVVPDLLAAINTSSKYSDAKGDMVNIAISKKAMECSSHHQLITTTSCQKHDKDEYFSELDLLLKLQKVLNCEQIVSIPNAIIILQQALEIFAEYAEPGNVQLQHQIQGYGYCLQQQYEYVKFFASVCKAELPDHAKIAELITACHAKVTENLEYQVSSLPIDEDKPDQVYYHKAIKYLEDYPDSPACKNLKAIAYSCVASIAEQNGENGALAYYVKAIEANSHLPKIYEKLGQLFFNKGEYAKAIDCYKVINNAVRINECFKAWLKQDAENPDIMLKQAEYFESVGLFEQAKKYYFNASSISQDDNFKAAAYNKISNIMVNAAAQGQDFATKAQEHNFYNYDLVNEEFTNNLLGDSGLECDL